MKRRRELVIVSIFLLLVFLAFLNFRKSHSVLTDVSQQLLQEGQGDFKKKKHPSLVIPKKPESNQEEQEKDGDDDHKKKKLKSKKIKKKKKSKKGSSSAQLAMISSVPRSNAALSRSIHRYSDFIRSIYSEHYHLPYILEEEEEEEKERKKEQVSEKRTPKKTLHQRLKRQFSFLRDSMFMYEKEVEWFLFMRFDSLIVDFDFDVESLISSPSSSSKTSEDENDNDNNNNDLSTSSVLPEGVEIVLSTARVDGKKTVSSAVILIKNTPWSRGFLDRLVQFDISQHHQQQQSKYLLTSCVSPLSCLVEQIRAGTSASQKEDAGKILLLSSASTSSSSAAATSIVRFLRTLPSKRFVTNNDDNSEGGGGEVIDIMDKELREGNPGLPFSIQLEECIPERQKLHKCSERFQAAFEKIMEINHLQYHHNFFSSLPVFSRKPVFVSSSNVNGEEDEKKDLEEEDADSSNIAIFTFMRYPEYYFDSQDNHLNSEEKKQNQFRLFYEARALREQYAAKHGYDCITEVENVQKTGKDTKHAFSQFWSKLLQVLRKHSAVLVLPPDAFIASQKGRLEKIFYSSSSSSSSDGAASSSGSSSSSSSFVDLLLIVDFVRAVSGELSPEIFFVRHSSFSLNWISRAASQDQINKNDPFLILQRELSREESRQKKYPPRTKNKEKEHFRRVYLERNQRRFNSYAMQNDGHRSRVRFVHGDLIERYKKCLFYPGCPDAAKDRFSSLFKNDNTNTNNQYQQRQQQGVVPKDFKQVQKYVFDSNLGENNNNLLQLSNKRHKSRRTHYKLGLHELVGGDGGEKAKNRKKKKKKNDYDRNDDDDDDDTSKRRRRSRFEIVPQSTTAILTVLCSATISQEYLLEMHRISFESKINFAKHGTSFSPSADGGGDDDGDQVEGGNGGSDIIVEDCSVTEKLSSASDSASLPGDLRGWAVIVAVARYLKYYESILVLHPATLITNFDSNIRFLETSSSTTSHHHLSSSHVLLVGRDFSDEISAEAAQLWRRGFKHQHQMLNGSILLSKMFHYASSHSPSSHLVSGGGGGEAGEAGVGHARSSSSSIACPDLSTQYETALLRCMTSFGISRSSALYHRSLIGYPSSEKENRARSSGVVSNSNNNNNPNQHRQNNANNVINQIHDNHNLRNRGAGGGGVKRYASLPVAILKKLISNIPNSIPAGEGTAAASSTSVKRYDVTAAQNYRYRQGDFSVYFGDCLFVFESFDDCLALMQQFRDLSRRLNSYPESDRIANTIEDVPKLQRPT